MISHVQGANGLPKIIQIPSNKYKFVVPSVYLTANSGLASSSKTITPKRFIQAVLEGVKLPQTYTTPKAILTYITEGQQIKKIHFRGFELSFMYSVFLHITNGELRPMTPVEFGNFIYGSFLITNTFVLSGLLRAVTNIVIEEGLPKQKGVGHHAFVCLMSIWMRGNFKDRAQLAFSIMDIDNDGLLRGNVEFSILLKNGYRKEFNMDQEDIFFDEAFRDTVRFLAHKMEIEKGNSLQRDKFVAMCIKEPWLLESLIPAIPGDIENLTFQSLFSTNCILPELNCNNRIRTLD